MKTIKIDDSYDLPRPDDPEWLLKNGEGSSYICDICKGRTIHIERYDRYACKHCNRWQEKGCDDPDCEFCGNAPEKPF